MKEISAGQRFLVLYSGVLTCVLAVALLCGFAKYPRTTSFDEINVHRINVVEPDGTIRMVLTDKQRAPGAYIKGKEYPHEDRKAAGLLFFDDEGTENGGLIYGLSYDTTGHVSGSNVHLSFDQYMQDQIFTVDAGHDGAQKFSTLTMADRGDYSIMEAIEANKRISKLSEKDQAAEWERFMRTHPGDHTRVVLGRTLDGASLLKLKDSDGNDRIVMRVAADGSPSLQLLDGTGKVINEMSGSGRSPSAGRGSK